MPYVLLPSSLYPDAVPYCRAETYHEIDWPASVANENHTRPCPKGETGTMTRLCNAQGFWEVAENKCGMFLLFLINSIVKIGEFCEKATIGIDLVLWL